MLPFCYVLTELSVKSTDVISLKLTDISKSLLLAAAEMFGRKLLSNVEKVGLVKPIVASLVKNNKI